MQPITLLIFMYTMNYHTKFEKKINKKIQTYVLTYAHTCTCFLPLLIRSPWVVEYPHGPQLWQCFILSVESSFHCESMSLIF